MNPLKFILPYLFDLAQFIIIKFIHTILLQLKKKNTLYIYYIYSYLQL